MLQKTNGIVLRSIKYGDTSLVTTIFTALFGVQTYLVQGVRSARSKNNRAGLMQPGMLLELVVYQRPEKNMQRIREFQAAYLYTSLHEEIIKNSIALFSVELLFRLLPEHAAMPELYDFVHDYFLKLDKSDLKTVANFPLYFIIQCSRLLGYDVKGDYNEATPYLSLQEGGFTDHMPVMRPFVDDADARVLGRLLRISTLTESENIGMNATMRFRLLEWYTEFLQQHTQHMGPLKSLAVLQAILH